MGKLQRLQDQLLSAVFAATLSSQFDTRGLQVYRANLRATATRALGITFPTVRQLLGEQAFAGVVERLLQYTPPSQGDWAMWGETLPELLAETAELRDYPFLGDCARLDFHCHQIMRCDFATTNFESLMLMQSHQPEDLLITLNPTLLLMQSDFPIAEIRRAHQQSADPAVALAQTIHGVGDSFYLACYLNHSKVTVQTLSAIEFAWLKALATKSLGDALTEFQDTDLSFEIWLTSAVQHNLLTDVIHQPNSEE